MKNSNLLTAALAFIAASFGGWSQLLTVLVVIISLDIITGILAAFVEKDLSSSIGRKGIAGKVMIFLLVAAGHYADVAIGTVEIHLIRNSVIYFYLAIELLSIIENAGRIGLPIPSVLKKAIEVLQGKAEVELPESEKHDQD